MTGTDDPVGCAKPCAGSLGATTGTDAGSTIEPSRAGVLAAPLHELAERLTATINYLAAVLRLSEVAGDRPLDLEALEKALGQLQRAGDIVVTLRKLLSEQER